MSKGEKAQLEIEPEWAYGKKGQPDAKYPSMSSDSLGNLGMLGAMRRFMDRNITEGFTCYSPQVQDIPTQGTSWGVQLPFWRKTRAGGTCCYFPPAFSFQLLMPYGDPNKCRETGGELPAAAVGTELHLVLGYS